MKTTSKTLILLGALAVIGACKDSGDGDSEHDESPAAPDCQAITDACHTVDDGKPNEINTCHSKIAHENEPAKCAAEKSRCVALCAAATGGADAAAGHGDAGH